MGADVSSVELADREMGHLVAEHFPEERSARTLQMRRDANEVLLGIAPGEASGEPRAPLDATRGFEVGDFPEVKPALEAVVQGIGETGLGVHGREG
jgi:hypothetical protein